MRISRMLKRILMPGRSQKGFSIAEVMVAGTLLALVSMPMMQMFNTSLQMSNLTDDLNKVQVCVTSFSEKVRALPYYVGYTGTNQDFDDFFWGTSRGTANNWSTAPEVMYKDYGATPYSQFKVTVKMVYLADDLSDAIMRASWGPKKSGYDKPTSSDNKVLHMIKYEVKAYWQPYPGGESNFSTAAIRTDTEAEIGLLVATCTNISADVNKHGSKHVISPGDDSADNTAPHTKDGISLDIKGKGFIVGGTTVKLAMDKNADIPVSNLVIAPTGDEITCTVDLSLGGTAGFPWSTKRSPGGWAVMVFVDKNFAVLLDGLIVEFPKPVLTAVTPANGKDNDTALSIKVTGAPILSLGGTCSAVLRLVKKGADGSPDTSKIIDSTAVATVTTTGNTASYTANPNYITATFNLTGKEVGDYYLWVVNCKNNGSVGQLGDVTGSSQNATAGAFVFQILKAPPSVTSVYETASPNRTYGFSNSTYNLTIKGIAFDTSTDAGHGVTVYIGRPNAAPTVPYATGVNAVVVDGLTITADFNLSPLAANVGACWVWVQNNYYMQSGSLANAYTVRTPPGTSGATSTLGFFYNYYDIPVALTGTNYYSGYGVCFQNQSGGDVFTVTDGDGEAAPVYGSLTAMTAQLNLINEFNNLPVGTYKIWVADPAEEDNTTGYATFTSSYGAPVMLTTNSPYQPPSLWIRYQYQNGTNIATNWSGWLTSFEDGSKTTDNSFEATCPTVKANGSPSYTRRVKFKMNIQGKGFLDANSGLKTEVDISNHPDPNATAVKPQVQAVLDRSGKTVILYTASWDDTAAYTWYFQTVNSAGTFTLKLTNKTGVPTEPNTPYTNRWRTIANPYPS